MRPRKLENGNILIPMRAESDDGNLIGDGAIKIGPEHPDYAMHDGLIRSWAETERLEEDLLERAGDVSTEA